MHRWKQLLTLAVVGALLLSFTTGAFAASYTAANYSDLETAFADDSGEDVEITLTGDIEASGTLTAQDGIEYTITASDDSYTLENAHFDGSGTVEITADLTNTLVTDDSVAVTVNGNITTNESDEDGIQASGSSTVTVNGNITAGRDGVDADDNSTVTVNGDITAGNSGVIASGDTNGNGGASVTVTGDIKADGDGVNAYDGSTVTVTGDINAGDDGVYAVDNSTVTVIGNITADDDGVYACGDDDKGEGGASVTVTGDITAGEDGDGVNAYDSSIVTVTGDITAGDDGVDADDDSVVTVTGNITADEDGVKAEDDSKVTVNGNIIAVDDGVNAEDDCIVTVTGDITAGDDGVDAEDDSTVTVNGSIIADDDGVSVDDDSVVTVTGNITAGYWGVNMENTNTVTVGGNVTADEDGVCVYFYYESDNENHSAGALVVYGSVTGGADSFDLLFKNGDSDCDLSDYLLPSLTVGAYSSASVEGFTEDELAELLPQVVVTGLDRESTDSFWWNVYALICRAAQGDTVIVDAGERTDVPVCVLRAAWEHGVTLVIRWNGGEDITLSGYECKETAAVIALADLAALLKK